MTGRSHHSRDRWRYERLDADMDHRDIWLERNRLKGTDAERDNTDDEAKALIASAFLDVLSPSQREVVQLVIMEAVPHSAAALMLGISRSAVDKRVERARKKLRQAAIDLSESGNV